MYTKTTWIDDVTPISAVNMNKIEQGVLDAVTVITGATTSKTASFPKRTGADPYTYTVVAISFPISVDDEIVELYMVNGYIKLFRDTNTAVIHGYNAASLFLVDVNLGFGATVIASSAPTSLLSFGNIFGLNAVDLVIIDAYISGTNVILKIVNPNITVRSDVTQNDIKYLTRK